MNSVFNPDYQQNDIDSKIVVALERISQAFRILLWDKVKQHGLSTVQVQIVTYLSFTPAEDCTVTFFANKLNLTKATLSDAVSALKRKKIVLMKSLPEDARVSIICLTSKGKRIAEDLNGWADKIRKLLEQNTINEKSTVLLVLIKLIKSLEEEKILNFSRICFTCKYFLSGEKNYCRLLEKDLPIAELRVDCPEHESK